MPDPESANDEERSLNFNQGRNRGKPRTWEFYRAKRLQLAARILAGFVILGGLLTNVWAAAHDDMNTFAIGLWVELAGFLLLVITFLKRRG